MSWSFGVGAEIVVMFQQLSGPTAFDFAHDLQYHRCKPAFDLPEPSPQELIDEWRAQRAAQGRIADEYWQLPPPMPKRRVKRYVAPILRPQWHRKRCHELAALCDGLDEAARRVLAHSFHTEYAVPLPMALVYARVG